MRGLHDHTHIACERVAATLARCDRLSPVGWVADLNLTIRSAGTRPRSFTSMPCALAHSRTSVVFSPPAFPRRLPRASLRALPPAWRAASTYRASASRSSFACRAFRSISYSVPSSPERTVPSAVLPFVLAARGSAPGECGPVR